MTTKRFAARSRWSKKRLDAYHVAVKIWVNRAASFAEESEADAEFWRQIPPDERVVILEQMREAWQAEHGEGDEGLRRIARRVSAS